jgi:hypothetical protein
MVRDMICDLNKANVSTLGKNVEISIIVNKTCWPLQTLRKFNNACVAITFEYKGQAASLKEFQLLDRNATTERLLLFYRSLGKFFVGN